MDELHITKTETGWTMIIRDGGSSQGRTYRNVIEMSVDIDLTLKRERALERLQRGRDAGIHMLPMDPAMGAVREEGKT